jgi:hypothetical protein
MLRRVAHVRTDVSEELSASFIRVTRFGELGTTLAVTSNRYSDDMKEILYMPEDSSLLNIWFALRKSCITGLSYKI